MITERQLLANRENAQKGGVKSEAGKLVSRMNASKHGGMTNSILEGESGLYEEAIQALSDAESSKIFVEKILVERAAMCVLQMRRVSFAESEFVRQIDDPTVTRSLLICHLTRLWSRIRGSSLFGAGGAVSWSLRTLPGVS